MKNVDVAWRLIDVMKEWQKLKKVFSKFPPHPGFDFGYCSNRTKSKEKLKGLPH